MKRLLFLSGLFITLVIASNFMAVKTTSFFGFIVPSAVILYPFCFAVGDIINEYFGFKMTRRVAFLTFIFNAVAVVFLSIAAILPASPFFEWNDGFRNIFLSTSRFLLASFAAFLISSVLDSYVFSRFKKAGSAISVRAAVSSILGVTVDSFIFIFGAFLGSMPFLDIIIMTFTHIVIKLIFGVVIGVPATVLCIKLLPPLSENDKKYFENQ